MKISKILTLSIIVWLLATLPWLLTRALSSFDWIKWSLIFGSKNTVGVVGFLLFWGLLRKKFRVPSTGLSLMILYLLLAGAILITGFLEQAKEPLIWEGALPAIIMLCPITQLLIFAMPFIPFPFYLIPAICFGCIFYYFLGNKAELFLHHPQSNGVA